MDSVDAIMEAAPAIELQQVSVEWDGAMEGWNIHWRINNKAAHSLQIDSVRLPHGQFKAEEQRFEPALLLRSGADARFQTPVRCDEPAGLVTENAFLIFHVVWLGEPWRILARVRVEVDSNGEPKTAVELITTQKIGFSGVAS